MALGLLSNTYVRRQSKKTREKLLSGILVDGNGENFRDFYVGL